jgi:Uma2 family endonuclease
MAPVGVERPRVSYADLERMPEDGRRYELYDGEVFVVPAPVPRHQIVQIALTELLRRWAGRHGGFVVSSPIDIIFTEHDVLQPDVVLFRPERTHLIDLDRPIRHVPDLCVEVLSPSTAAADRGRKMQAFARFGVPEYWTRRSGVAQHRGVSIGARRLRAGADRRTRHGGDVADVRRLDRLDCGRLSVGVPRTREAGPPAVDRSDNL